MKLGLLRILCLAILVNSLTTSAASGVDFQDFRTPVIQEFKQNLIPVFENNEYFLEIEYEVVIKSFNNQLSGMELAYTYEQKDYPAGCQLLSANFQPFRVEYGDYPLKLDSLKQPTGLVETEKFSGFQIEKHKFKVSTKSFKSVLNTKFKFCDQILKLFVIEIWDIAGHQNIISLNPNVISFDEQIYTTYPNLSGFQFFNELFTNKSIIGSACPKLSIPYEKITSVTLYSVCNHIMAKDSHSIVLSPQLSKDAEAAADLLAQQKVAMAKAAADKAAADKAATKAVGVAKKTTITCFKGKLTKKVTAVKPKCPSGYKVKK